MKVHLSNSTIFKQKQNLHIFRNVFLMIFSNGTLWTNYRMKLTGPCDMNLKVIYLMQIFCVLKISFCTSTLTNSGEVERLKFDKLNSNSFVSLSDIMMKIIYSKKKV
jgi:hypothetical protein